MHATLKEYKILEIVSIDKEKTSYKQINNNNQISDSKQYIILVILDSGKFPYANGMVSGRILNKIINEERYENSFDMLILSGEEIKQIIPKLDSIVLMRKLVND